MSREFQHHEACPACRERGEDTAGDNLAVYADGHKHCFKCGHREGVGNTLAIKKISENLQEEKEKDTDGTAALPVDFTFALPESVLNWLRSYDITDEEIALHNFGWSDKYQSLVYPVFGSHDNLLMVQSRRFDARAKSRFHTSGYPEHVFHMVGHEKFNGTLVIVEDMISAIKVGRACTAMPIWGSSISSQRLYRLAKLLDNLIIWLDQDKIDYAIQRSVTARIWFNSVRVISTNLDPKCYDDVQIKEILDVERS